MVWKINARYVHLGWQTDGLGRLRPTARGLLVTPTCLSRCVLFVATPDLRGKLCCGVVAFRCAHWGKGFQDDDLRCLFPISGSFLHLSPEVCTCRVCKSEPQHACVSACISGSVLHLFPEVCTRGRLQKRTAARRYKCMRPVPGGVHLQ